MSLKKWESRVLEIPGAPARVAEIENELRLAAGLAACASRQASNANASARHPQDS